MLLILPFSELLANNGVLKFSNQSVDLGLVSFEETYRINIPFKNIGTEKTHLLRVDTDCGCSKASFSKEWLFPGDSAILSVDFKPTEGETPFYRNIILLTDSKISQYTISLQGEVTNLKKSVSINNEHIVKWTENKKAIPILSNYALTLKANVGEEFVYPLFISNLGRKPLIIKEIDTKGMAQTMELPRTIEQGEVLMIPLKITFPEKGEFRDYFKIKTDEKNLLIRIQSTVN